MALRTLTCVTLGLATFAGGCIGTPVTGTDGDSSAALRRFPLDSLEIATVSVNDHEFRVWLADSAARRTEGLMFVTENELADNGMLFVFPNESELGFWMKNTVTPLDIAFARMDGTIVAIHTMPPLTLRTFPSLEPAMFALEVKANTFERLGIREGDRLIIPSELFKN